MAKPEKQDAKKPVAKKDKKERKAGIVKFFRSVISEMKKVTWPTRKELVNYTIVVIVVVIIVAAVVGVMDLGFGQLLQLITR